MDEAKDKFSEKKPVILLTGATGYIGGRLIQPLEKSGYTLRLMARRPGYLATKTAPSTQVVYGDVFDPESLNNALSGVDIAYYFIHSLGNKNGWQDLDRKAAENFAKAAQRQGVSRIIYLGGLGADLQLSEHLSSRQEVGRILAGTGIQVIEFRASIVLGSGSLSFEMIRTLTNRLPVMLMPRWIRVKAQPIAIEDVVEYLLKAIDIDIRENQTFEIGGADRVSYMEIMKEYAKQRGLNRLMIPVPVLTPKLSSLWLGLITPLYARVGRRLMASVYHETIVTNDQAEKTFGIKPKGVAEAISRALINEDQEFAVTRWSDALSSLGPVKNWTGVKFGLRHVDTRVAHVDASPEIAFAPIRRIGGKNGWYYANWLWKLRGRLDVLAGGTGMKRSRCSIDSLCVGDTVDWWRVDEFEPDRLLRLSAEMKLPGRAWLQYEVESSPEGGSTIRQTALFDPIGLPGLLYWYSLYPFHQFIFSGMLNRIVQHAESETNTQLLSNRQPKKEKNYDQAS